MKIKFVGSHQILRTVGHYTWSKQNSFVSEIADGPFCADLLTANEEFKLAADEPLLSLMSENEIVELALAGLANIQALAALNPKGMIALSELTGKSVKQIRDWVKQSQSFMEAENGK